LRSERRAAGLRKGGRTKHQSLKGLKGLKGLGLRVWRWMDTNTGTWQKEVRRPVAAPVAAAGSSLSRYSVRARAARGRWRPKYCATHG
jgi:hypothetical protein